jgi:PKD repeat protein
MTLELFSLNPMVANAQKKVAFEITPLLRKFALFSILLLMLVSGKADAQLAAHFSTSDTAGCAPLIVNFTNTSTGATSYNWDLGNGSFSSLADVSGNYLTAGTYTVTLVAHNGPATSTVTNVIRVYAPPTINFTGSDTAICPYAPVTFTSTSIPGSWGSLSYNWNFGDGYSSSAISPTHTYPAPGFYNVSLFATNAKGCVNSYARTAYIHVLTPAAISFTSPATSFCKPPSSVVFSNTSTGTAPISYSWTFGDGGVSGIVSPTHNYTSSGTFSVRVIATDGKGCKDTIITPNYVNIANFAASFIAVPLSCGATPVTFVNTSSTHISSQWFFGDGGTSSDENGVHIYMLAGAFTVKLIVFDGTCYDTITHPINISYPAGNFVRTPAYPCPPPSALTFTATMPPGCTAAWRFDDGTTAAGPSVVHTYLLSSIYTTSLVITNALGCKDTVTKLDTLYNLNINPTPTDGAEGCIPLTSSFSCYTYSVVYNPFTLSTMFLSYPSPISTYLWNFGDGGPTSSSPTPSHVFTAAGIFHVSCTIITSNGCTKSAIIDVRAGSPQAPSYTCTPRRICSGRTIAFHSTSTNTLLIDNYIWNYGDGIAAQGILANNPIHEYSVPGIYNPSLIVKYNGCPSLPFHLTDTVDSPGASIALTYDCIPARGIAFGDSSYGDNTHLWMFGDGGTSTLRNIDHLYPSLSSYNVTLATYNAISGCRDTARASVNLAKPTFSIYGYDSTVCRGQFDTIILALGGVRTANQIYWIDNGIVKDSATINAHDTFTVAGMHNIRVLIKDNVGCYDTSQFIHVMVGLPVDSFSFSPPLGCGPLAVNFVDHSSDVPGTSLSSYFWTFGDGSPGASGPSSITHIYTTAGTYTISETVTDNMGCSASFVSATNVVVRKPVASFSVTATTVCAGTAVHFANTSSGITGALWFFGDGLTSSLTAPSHTYATFGVYSVSLVVYDIFGCASDTLIMPGLITVNFSPASSFHMSDSFAVCAPLNVTYYNTTTGAVSYYWTFGDATSSIAPAPSDVYVFSGLYHVTLVATSANGCTDTARHDVSIFGYPGAFTYTPLTGCTPVHVNFTSTATGVFNFHWDFRDGTTLTSFTATTASHTYAYAGNYVPTLILTDSTGCISASFGVDTIKVDTLIPAFSYSPIPACQGAAITFHDATVSGSLLPMAAWLWSFGAGITSTLSSPTYTYSVVGAHTVTLTVTSSSGCIATTTQTVTVNPAPAPVSGPSVLCQGLSVTYSDASPLGTWTSSNPGVATIGSASGLASGITSGTATITYISGPGCPAVKLVTVSPSPSPISGVTGICIANSAVFIDTTAGGVWSIAPLTIASVSPTGTVTGIGSGTATLSYTKAGCSATKSIIISTTPTAISGPASVCVGSSVTLADGVPGGLWSSASALVSVGSASGSVTGVTAGTTAVITYSLGSGCTVTRAIAVNAGSIINGPHGVCVSGLINLTTTGTGGTWSSTVPTTASVTPLGLVTGVSPGITTIFYTLPITGCATAWAVTVNILPLAIGGSLSVCQFASTTLTNVAGGGVWSVIPTTTATIDPASGLLTGVLTGTATVTYALGSTTGCQRFAIITVNAAPAVITGSLYVCPGATTHLFDATTPGAWSASSSLASIGSAGIVTGISPGVATITYTAAVNGCMRTNDVTVNPFPTPILGPSSICIGVPATYTSTLPGATFTSLNPVIATIGSTSGSAFGITPGTVTFGCPAIITSTTCQATITVTVTSTPLPVTGVLHACVGNLSSLSNGSPGGTWSISNGAATIGASTGVVHAFSPGLDTVTYSIGVGCQSIAVFTVNSLPSAIYGPGNVCAGSSIALADTPIGGRWTTSNPFIAIIDSASGVATGVAAGTTIVTYSLGIGCNAFTPILVKPLPGGISGPSYVCLGATASLTDLTPLGVWSSTNSFIAPVSAAGLVTGLSGGLAIISYTIANGCAATRSMSVVAVPAITGLSGPLHKCAWTDTISINDASVGGIFTSYLVTAYTLGGSGDGVLITHAPGLAVVTYILPSGCSTTSLLTINPLPASIAGNGHVCVGIPASFTDASPGGVWSSPGYAAIATIDSATGVVAGIGTGTASITYTLPVTGCFVDTFVYVAPQPGPITGPSSICSGALAIFSNAVPGGTWASSNVAVATVGAGTGLVTGGMPGVDTISYTLGAACAYVKVITVSALPALNTTVGGGIYCYGGTGVHVYLGGSQVGVNYQLYNGPSPVDTPMHGTGIAIDFGMQPGVGTYTVIATNVTTLCTRAMPGSAVVSINPVPGNYFLTGGGSYCAGGVGTHIGLGGSAFGITYRVRRGTTAVGPLLGGTGLALDFGLFTVAGTYKVFATNTVTGCTAFMPDSILISITPTVIPSVGISVSPGDTVCAGTPVTFTCVAVNGGLSPFYQWRVNGSGGATGSVYTYSPANGDHVTVQLTSTAICPLPDTASAAIDLIVDPQLNPVVTITSIPGTSIAPGQYDTLIAIVTNGGIAPAYQWYRNTLAIAGAVTDTLIRNDFSNKDSVSCVVTSNGLCGGLPGSHGVSITVISVGVLLLRDAGDITVLPNPNKGVFIVKGSLGGIIDEELSLEITDMLGQSVYKKTVMATGGMLNEEVYPQGHLANGVYLLTLRSANNNRVFHIVMER